MMNRIIVRLLLLISAVLVGMPTAFPDPAQFGEQDSCPAQIARALAENSISGPAFSQRNNLGTWSFYGITGEMRTWEADPRSGLVFDLVQLYLGDRVEPIWVALGASVPPYALVYDSTSHQIIQAEGNADRPFYVSLVEGLDQRAEIQGQFNHPGRFLMELTVSGERVAQETIDRGQCQSVECLLAAYVDRYFSVDGLPLSEAFVSGDFSPNYPGYGFLAWEMRQVRAVNACEPTKVRDVIGGF